MVAPRKSTEIISLPIEFDPIVTIKLWEAVGTAKPDDILIFVPYADDGIDNDTVYVAETKAQKPFVFLGRDYNPETFPPIEGKAVRVVTKL